VGKRPRQSPISASSRAALTVPLRGQAGEDLLVGVLGELLADLHRQGLDLVGQRAQHGQQRRCDVGLNSAVGAGSAARGGH